MTALSDTAPENGLRGLKHFKHDALAGLVVSLVSLPLSSGIAIASGAPPIYGILSSVIAGLIFPFVGGSYVTISGPAAGLAPALLVTMAALGGAGDADHVGAGYPLLLAVICLVGVAQIVLSWLRLARFAAIFPASVVEGMLGAIGVLIIVKSLPLFFGYEGQLHPHGVWEYLRGVPTYAAEGSQVATWVAVACLAFMGALSTRVAQRVGVFRLIPGPLWAVVVGIGLGLVLGLPTEQRIFVPSDPFSGLQAPAFGVLWERTDLWWAAGVGILTLTLIDGVESLATTFAVDRIDPFQRRSAPNRVLLAMGVSNLCSSLIGGLTIIPGGVKSKTNISAGGRTLWANFMNAVFLLLYLVLAYPLIGLIPKSALAAVLVFTGYTMCKPAIARHLAYVGREQLLLYGVTVAVTLAEDLLWGIAAGTALKLLITVWYARRLTDAPRSSEVLVSLFRSPVVEEVQSGSTWTLTLGRPLVCFNAFHVAHALEQVPEGVEEVVLRVGSEVRLIDHTAYDGLMQVSRAFARGTVRVEGLDALHKVSAHEKAVRVRPAVKSTERGVRGAWAWTAVAAALTPALIPVELGAELEAEGEVWAEEERDEREA